MKHNKNRIKKQLIREFEIVDGFPVLDEYEHIDDSPSIQPYRIDFRLPLKGINPKMLSPTLLNVCNMFSNFYFMQLVIVMSDKALGPPKQVIESQPIMLKFIH